MTKYLWTAITCLILALGASLYGLKVAHEELGGMTVALESAQAALTSQKALTDRIQTQVQREKTRADANRLELRNALKNNAEWAARPVPADVSGSLCKPPAMCSQQPAQVRRAPD